MGRRICVMWVYGVLWGCICEWVWVCVGVGVSECGCE